MSAPIDLQLAPIRPGMSAARRTWIRSRRFVLGVLGFVAVLALWQLAASLGWIDATLVGSPAGLVPAAIQYFGPSGTGPADVAISLKEFGIGIGLSIVVGMVVGIVLGLSKFLDELLQPLVTFAYAAPHIALVPILVIFFGIGMWSKVAVVFLSAVFPVIINTQQGITSVDPDLRRVARSFQAGRVQTVVNVLLPGALPLIVAGIRMAISRGLVGMVAGEVIAATAGLGYSIAHAANTFQTNEMFVILFVVAFASVIASALLRLVEVRLSGWRQDF